MAKFLDGSGVQSVLTDIIKNAEKNLYIVTPYLKIPIQTKSYLKTTDKRNIPITIVYRTDFTLNEEDIAFFHELTHLELLHCDNLHSKCYINEKDGLIASMNLHEHSQTHNWEMGIKFSKQDDLDIYKDVDKELSHLLSLSKPHLLKKKVSESKRYVETSDSHKTVYKPKEAPNKGLFTKVLDSVIGEEAYCIRCGHSIAKYNLEKPLCNKCFPIWANHKNKLKYPEKHCHACGELKSNISFEKPVCYDCFCRLHT